MEERININVSAVDYDKTSKAIKKINLSPKDKDLATMKPASDKKMMGGGMMQRPMGYKSGTMVKARGCKLGRTRPTKMY